MDPPRLVSVVIPAKDASRTIVRAVRSVLAQDYDPLEVIVVDDGSSDATADIATGLGDPRVRVLRNAATMGAAEARNIGIRAAAGDIVAFQDADDEWLPGKLTSQVALLCADNRHGFVACGAELIAPDGRNLGALYQGQAPPPGDMAWRALLARNTIATPSVVVWRSELEALGGFNPALRIAEDQDMWIRLAMRRHLGYLDATLVRVHITPNSLSGVAMRRSYQDQLRYTLPMVQQYVALKRQSLSQRELRAIMGERWGRLGRAAYSDRCYRDGLRMVLHAMVLGHEPLENMLFLLSAAPPARWLKRRLGLRRP